MKGKTGVMLFGLPFCAIGVWMAYSIGATVHDGWQMRHWEPVQAQLVAAGYKSHAGDDSSTYEAYATYAYEFGGRQYTGNRVSIAGGADNIGDFQTDLGGRLSAAMSNRQNITVYVNANEPVAAVIDRSIRWGLLGFKSIFLIVFGGFGFGLLIFSWRTPTREADPETELVNHPWLVNSDWATSIINSSSKSSMRFAWIFAAIWNLISVPLPFLVYEEYTQKNNLPALLGLLFPIIGVGILLFAIRRTLEWRRFGAAPVTLDPFPGSIGGHVGGTIDVNLPYEAGNQFRMTLTCLHSYISGSGNDRSRRERAQWQDSQVAHTAMSAAGSRLSFRFDVPTDMQESDADRSDDSYFIWRLNVQASLPGTDINRDYDIPVYATGQASLRLADFSAQQARTAQSKLDHQEISKLFELQHAAAGSSMLFPMGRNLSGGLFGTIFGSIFAAVGWYLLMYESSPFIGSVFGLAGSLVVIAALYCVFNSLEVTRSSGELRTIRRVLGIVVRERTMRLNDFVKFSKKKTSTSQSGSKHVVYYSVAAVDRQSKRLVLGEGFKGVNQADTAIEFIAKTFGLVTRDRATAPSQHTVEQYNFLTTD